MLGDEEKVGPTRSYFHRVYILVKKIVFKRGRKINTIIWVVLAIINK